MRKMLCLLTDVKIRQFTDKEFRSGPDMRLSGANWDFTYFFGRSIVILLTWSQNVSLVPQPKHLGIQDTYGVWRLESLNC